MDLIEHQIPTPSQIGIGDGFLRQRTRVQEEGTIHCGHDHGLGHRGGGVGIRDGVGPLHDVSARRFKAVPQNLSRADHHIPLASLLFQPDHGKGLIGLGIGEGHRPGNDLSRDHPLGVQIDRNPRSTMEYHFPNFHTAVLPLPAGHQPPRGLTVRWVVGQVIVHRIEHGAQRSGRAPDASLPTSLEQVKSPHSSWTVARKHKALRGWIPHGIQVVVRRVHMIWEYGRSRKGPFVVQGGHVNVQAVRSFGAQTVAKQFLFSPPKGDRCRQPRLLVQFGVHLLGREHDPDALSLPLDVAVEGHHWNADRVQLLKGLPLGKGQRHLPSLGEGQRTCIPPWGLFVRLTQGFQQRRFRQLWLSLKHPCPSPPVPPFPLQISRVGERRQALDALVSRPHVVQQSRRIPHLKKHIRAIQTEQFRHSAVRQFPFLSFESLHGLRPHFFRRHIPLAPSLEWRPCEGNHEPQPQCDKGRVKSAKPVRRDKTEKG